MDFDTESDPAAERHLLNVLGAPADLDTLSHSAAGPADMTPPGAQPAPQAAPQITMQQQATPNPFAIPDGPTAPGYSKG